MIKYRYIGRVLQFLNESGESGLENTSIQNVKNKKNIMFSLLIFALAVAIAGVGGTLAFLTKNTEKRANNFTFGNVSIELTEEEWEKLPPKDKIIYPEKTIPKDPVIKNTGKNDAYVYMEVKVPMAEVRIYDEDGKIEDAKMRDLFTFKENDGWEKLDLTKEEEYSDDYHVYLYVYNKPLDNDPLSPNNSTSPLFDEVKVIPMVEGEDELKMDSSIEIPITAYAIQSEYVKEFVEEFVNGNKDSEVFKAVFEKYVQDKS